MEKKHKKQDTWLMVDFVSEDDELISYWIWSRKLCNFFQATGELNCRCLWSFPEEIHQDCCWMTHILYNNHTSSTSEGQTQLSSYGFLHQILTGWDDNRVKQSPQTLCFSFHIESLLYRTTTNLSGPWIHWLRQDRIVIHVKSPLTTMADLEHPKKGWWEKKTHSHQARKPGQPFKNFPLVFCFRGR